MKNSIKVNVRLISLIVLGLLFFSTPSYAVSTNVAIVDNPGVINGGTFPTTTSGPTGDFNTFSFTNLAVANVNTANLASYDTVLLNVASSGMNCNTSSLSASQQSDLVSFVNGGGKLIIYDSECTSTDYSWLPFSFTTLNPGALGATGTLTINDNNDLSSNVLASPKYIDAVSLATNTDAVGDMNVMKTFDPNWCLDMTGRNAIPAEGAVHAYATFGSGLIIWNGLDVDVMNASTSPDSSTNAGNLAKLWLQELQVTSLLCGTRVAQVSSIPTMTEWGMIIFIVLAGLGGIYYLREKRSV